MLFHTVGQSQVFLSMMYAGLAIGAWYDVLGFVRRVLEAGKPLTAALDGVFALGVAVMLVTAMLLVNGGEMRMFCLLGAGCGVVIYWFTVRPLLRLIVVRPARWALRQARRLVQTGWMKKVLK